MAINGIAISKRKIPFDPLIQANGSYTFPQQGFIPAPGTRPIASGHIPVAHGHAENPGFIMAKHNERKGLPPINLGNRAIGIRTQIAHINTNQHWIDTNGLFYG